MNNNQIDDPAFLKAIFDNAGCAIFTVNTKGTITSFNPEAERMLGDKAADMIGKATPAIFHDKDEVIRKAEEFSKELNEQIMPGFDVFVVKARKNLPNISEWTYTRKDGTRLPVLLSVTALRSPNNEIYGYMGIATNILRYKKNQMELENYKNALDQHSIVVNTNLQGKITYVNDKFCAISKYERHELIGQDHRIVNSGYHHEVFMFEMWRTIASGRVWKGQIKNKAKDGSFYWVEATIVPILNAKGKIYQYISIQTSITEQLALNNEAWKKKEEAILFEEYKNIFKVSYELPQWLEEVSYKLPELLEV